MLVVLRRCVPLMDSPGPRAREVQGASTTCAPFGVHDEVTWALFPTLAECAAGRDRSNWNALSTVSLGMILD